MKRRKFIHYISRAIPFITVTPELLDRDASASAAQSADRMNPEGDGARFRISTIRDILPKIQHKAVQGQRQFAYEFSVIDPADIQVYRTPASADQTDTFLLKPSRDYSIVNNEMGPGGRVVLAQEAVAGDMLTILRSIPLERATRFQGFPDNIFELLDTDIDRLLLMIQQLNEKIGRAKLRPLVSQKFASADSESDLATLQDVMEIQSAANEKSRFVVKSLESALGERFDDSSIVMALGRRIAGDGGGGTFYFSESVPCSSADGGVVIDPGRPSLDLTEQGQGAGQGCLVRLTNDTASITAWWGTGVQAINAAIRYQTVRGGRVVVSGDTEIDAAIIMEDDVTLEIPEHVILSLTAPLRRMIEFGTAKRRQVLAGKGTIDVNGKAVYAIFGTASVEPRVEDIRILNWRRGIRFESSRGSPVVSPVLRNVTLGAPFHTRVGQPVCITCKPSTGGDLIEHVDIDGLFIEQAERGEFSARNRHTADQIALQGVIGGRVNDVRSSNGGENGMTLSFSTRNIELSNILVSHSDSNGIYITGAHYRIDLRDMTGAFQVGEKIRGEDSGASAEIEYVIDTTLWLHKTSREKIVEGERVQGELSRAQAQVFQSHVMRNVRVHESCRSMTNGLNARGARKDFAGLYVRHAENIGIGGSYSGNAIGVKIASSSWYAMGKIDLSGNAMPLRELSRSLYLSSIKDLHTQGTRVEIDQSGRIRLGPHAIGSPHSLDSDSGNNTGWTVNRKGGLSGNANRDAALKVGRTGNHGDSIELFARGKKIAGLGSAGIRFPEFSVAEANAIPYGQRPENALIHVTNGNEGTPCWAANISGVWRIVFALQQFTAGAEISES